MPDPRPPARRQSVGVVYVALLRGVNVGGRSRLPMPALRAIATGLGHRDVTTLLQSGNVVFSSDEADPAVIGAALERAIEESKGLEVSVIVRTHHELASALARTPYAAVDGTKAHVVFLSREPDPERVAALDPARSPPDRFTVDGREIHLDLPNGAGRTKLTLDWFERRLDVRGTARNRNTVERLVDLTAEG